MGPVFNEFTSSSLYEYHTEVLCPLNFVILLVLVQFDHHWRCVINVRVLRGVKRSLEKSSVCQP